MKDGPVLMLCVSGMISGALAIKITMDTNKTFNRELASLFVMQKRYECQNGIQPWLFGQILPYATKPKQKEEVKEGDDPELEAQIRKWEETFGQPSH